MRKEEWDLTNRAILEATHAVFEQCGVRVTHEGRSHDVPSGWMRVAVIGFAGSALRGMLALAIDAPLLLRTCPIDDVTCADEDWLGELANLVLGSFKRELMRLGITVHLSTPMIVHGPNITLDTAAVSAVVHHFVSNGGEHVHVVLDAIAEPSAHIGPPTPTASSGDVILF